MRKRIFILTIIISGLLSCNRDCEEITKYYNNGQVAIMKIYTDCKNKDIYKEYRYYETGELNGERIIHPDSIPIPYKTWYKNGVLSAIWHELDEKEHGVIRCYNKKGILIQKSKQNRGIRDGKYEKWFDDGSPRILGYYENDKLNDTYKIFDTLGGYSIMEYVNGTRNGFAYEFNIKNNGDTIIVKGFYKNDKEEGFWIFYNSNDEPQDSTLYKNGSEVVME